MSKQNCNCNTQSFYVDRGCAGHYASGSNAWKVNSTVISNIANGKTVKSSDINVVKNKIRDLAKKYNASDVFVANRGGKIPITEGSNYNSSTKINATQFNNIENMYVGIGGSPVANKSKGDIVIDEDWSRLISRFNALCENCICNTDCHCNTVCSVNADCGCNYS